MMNFIRGSVGIIALLIGACVTVLFFSYFYFSPREQSNIEMREVQPLTASGTVPMTEYERSRADIDAAKVTQDLLNAHNRATIEALGE